MNHIESSHDQPFAAKREATETTYKTVASGSVIAAIGGLSALVLGILGLVGIVPRYMASVAAIAFGVALVAEGGAIASRYTQLFRIGDGTYEKAEITGGSGSELLGGLAGGVLGLLALLGIAPITLLAASAIVFGAALLLGSGSTSRLNSLLLDGGTHHVERDAVVTAAGAQVLVGIAAIALGILALVGIAPMILVLVALLSLGSAAVITGTTIGGFLMSAFS